MFQINKKEISEYLSRRDGKKRKDKIYNNFGNLTLYFMSF